MSGTPRVVLVTRKTDYALLLEQHATPQKASFFLRSRAQKIDRTKARHESFEDVLRRVQGAIPRAWRQTSVLREDLHRFLFEPSDVVVAVGQDGLVANVAKYLSGQPVIGVNPEPERYDGVLVPVAVADMRTKLLTAAAQGKADLELRSMVEAVLDDGQRLLALNEVFVGHRSHQSARYRIDHGGSEELQSSSGVVVTTGTGATGWARSITRNRLCDVPLPSPDERRVAFFVREAFPSIGTGTAITDGSIVEGEELVVTSRMNSDGVIFGDGIEADRLSFGWGARASVGVASERLHLIHA